MLAIRSKGHWRGGWVTSRAEATRFQNKQGFFPNSEQQLENQPDCLHGYYEVHIRAPTILGSFIYESCYRALKMLQCKDCKDQHHGPEQNVDYKYRT